MKCGIFFIEIIYLATASNFEFNFKIRGLVADTAQNILSMKINQRQIQYYERWLFHVGTFHVGIISEHVNNNQFSIVYG